MKYNVYAYKADKMIGLLNTDDYESDQFADAMRKFEKDNKVVDAQFDIFNAVTNEWVSTIASFRGKRQI
jgi:hypothetical protein